MSAWVRRGEGVGHVGNVPPCVLGHPPWWDTNTIFASLLSPSPTREAVVSAFLLFGDSRLELYLLARKLQLC
jgi:hypothetical protein